MNNTDPQKTLKVEQLQPGKTYNCKIDGNLGPEVLTFVQLAKHAVTKRSFILVGSPRLFASHPEVRSHLTALSIKEIEQEDYDGAPYKVRGLQLWRCTVDLGGMEVDGYDWHLHDFVESDHAF